MRILEVVWEFFSEFIGKIEMGISILELETELEFCWVWGNRRQDENFGDFIRILATVWGFEDSMRILKTVWEFQRQYENFRDSIRIF